MSDFTPAGQSDSTSARPSRLLNPPDRLPAWPVTIAGLASLALVASILFASIDRDCYYSVWLGLARAPADGKTTPQDVDEVLRVNHVSSIAWRNAQAAYGGCPESIRFELSQFGLEATVNRMADRDP